MGLRLNRCRKRKKN